MSELHFGFSPCPNDTFAFDALVHGRLDTAVHVTPHMYDIEELNRRARAAEFEITKLSFGALAALEDTYIPLRAGAALGKGVGPLVVAATPGTIRELNGATIAIPGKDTTANLLLNLAIDDAKIDEVTTVEMRYDRILAAVESGEVDAGLIIHESRFTYADHGLVAVLDLGEWWESRTGLPVPLGVICVRNDIAPETRDAVEAALRASVEHAMANPGDSYEYVRKHAQEMSDAVRLSHIQLYVNNYTIDLGPEGMLAVDALLAAGHK